MLINNKKEGYVLVKLRDKLGAKFTKRKHNIQET